MNRLLSKFPVGVMFSAVLAGCASANKVQQEGPVGAITYSQYSLRTTGPAADTAYYVVTGQSQFDALFQVSGSGNRVPDFSSQTAVALALPPTAKAALEKITIGGRYLNVYVGNCAGAYENCSANGLLLATSPRSGSVREIRFFVNNVLRKSVPL